MPPARSLLRHPAAAAALLLCALLMRLLVPAGYMPAVAHGGVVLQLCPGTTPAAPAAAMPGMHHGEGGGHDAPARGEQPCAFAGLGAPAVGSADPVLQIATIAFDLLPPTPGRIWRLPVAGSRWWPPLRGPPAAA